MTEKLLFTPGPLSTSTTVKAAMNRDLGSRDAEFIEAVREIRCGLVSLAGPGSEDYEAVLMQGSGTFAIESVIGSAVPRGGRLLVAVNGAYGRRMVQIAERLGIETVALMFDEDEPVDAGRIGEALSSGTPFTHAAVIHCETTTGMLNPIDRIGEVVHSARAVFIVDAMSSFGGIPIDVAACNIDFLVSSANKCIQGVPGFGFVLARRTSLQKCEGQARSVSLDLFAQWRGLETDGQFRFTPPTHAILAFRRALHELQEEGGVAGRCTRYSASHTALMNEMSAMGFVPYLRREHQSPIITTFRYPADPRFHFEEFYTALSRRGFVIYPGKLTRENCFRIGTIGNIFPADIGRLAAAIREVLAEAAVTKLSPGRQSKAPGI
jgi:2-aminoethylphosphonate-pyruvate transaminase